MTDRADPLRWSKEDLVSVCRNMGLSISKHEITTSKEHIKWLLRLNDADLRKRMGSSTSADRSEDTLLVIRGKIEQIRRKVADNVSDSYLRVPHGARLYR